MQEGVKWWAISPHQACKQGVFGVVGNFTSSSMHARSVWGDNQAARWSEMVGHFTSQKLASKKCLGSQPRMQERVKWWAISPYQACKLGVFRVTTKHEVEAMMSRPTKEV